MSLALENLQDFKRIRKRKKIVGRGPSSKMGKTCCRGQKGMGARSGYKTRQGYEGGGVPLHKRMPTRGFSNVQFARRFDVINLEQIEKIYHDGETVSLESLKEKGFIKGSSHGIKVLGSGTLTKKLTFKVEAISEGAKDKLQQIGIVV